MYILSAVVVNFSCRCEAGDLAGKFGPLTATNQPLTLLDNTGTLFLRGQHSIIGRSIVIHRHGSNKNFECGTIRSQNEINGKFQFLTPSIHATRGHVSHTPYEIFMMPEVVFENFLRPIVRLGIFR